MDGVVVKLSSGFGFIRPAGTDPSDRSQDIFFNVTGVVNRDFGSLKVGDKVTYLVKESAVAGEKAKAVQVSRI